MISELQEQMCRLQLDIHRQIQERLLLGRGYPDVAAAGDSAAGDSAAGDGVAEPPPCSQDCACWEGSPVGTTLKYIRACVWGHFTGGGAGVSPNHQCVQWLNTAPLVPGG